jgi:hypothetical protein
MHVRMIYLIISRSIYVSDGEKLSCEVEPELSKIWVSVIISQFLMA